MHFPWSAVCPWITPEVLCMVSGYPWSAVSVWSIVTLEVLSLCGQWLSLKCCLDVVNDYPWSFVSMWSLITLEVLSLCGQWLPLKCCLCMDNDYPWVAVTAWFAIYLWSAVFVWYMIVAVIVLSCVIFAVLFLQDPWIISEALSQHEPWFTCDALALYAYLWSAVSQQHGAPLTLEQRLRPLHDLQHHALRGRLFLKQVVDHLQQRLHHIASKAQSQGAVPLPQPLPLIVLSKAQSQGAVPLPPPLPPIVLSKDQSQGAVPLPPPLPSIVLSKISHRVQCPFHRHYHPSCWARSVTGWNASSTTTTVHHAVYAGYRVVTRV